LEEGDERGDPDGAGGADPAAVGRGRTNAQIAKQARLSQLTVKNHVSTISGRLEVARRTEAAAYLLGRSGQFF
jgi:DNA-binding NarL/FixJ family response regulator